MSLFKKKPADHWVAVSLRGGATLEFPAAEFSINWNPENGKPASFEYKHSEVSSTTLLYLDPDEIVGVVVL